jgi:hypothetical protein
VGIIQGLLLLGLARAAAGGLAEPAYRYGHIRHAEPTARLPAPPADAENVQRNAPFLPGDRLWTQDHGRV